MIFKSKERVIQAFRYNLNKEQFPDWYYTAIEKGVIQFNDDKTLTIFGTDETYIAKNNDWIILTENSQIFPLSNTMFKYFFAEPLKNKVLNFIQGVLDYEPS